MEYSSLSNLRKSLAQVEVEAQQAMGLGERVVRAVQEEVAEEGGYMSAT